MLKNKRLIEVMNKERFFLDPNCAYYACFVPSCKTGLLFFMEKTVLLHLRKAKLLRIERQKRPAHGGNWTHDLPITRHLLYLCATIAAPSERGKILISKVGRRRGKVSNSKYLEGCQHSSWFRSSQWPTRGKWLWLSGGQSMWSSWVWIPLYFGLFSPK